MSRALEDLVGNMSVGELARLSGSTVEQVVARVLGGASARASGSSPAPAADAASKPATSTSRPPKKLPKGKLSTADVLAVLTAANGPVAAPQVRAELGGTANQVRAALVKLAEAGKIKVTGERRGTRYHAK